MPIQKNLLPTPHHMFAEKKQHQPYFAVHLGAGNIVFIQRQLTHTVLYEPLYKCYFCSHHWTNMTSWWQNHPMFHTILVPCYQNLFHAPEVSCPVMTASSKWSRFFCILLYAPSLDICLSDCIMSLNQPRLRCKSPEFKQLVPIWKQTNSPKGIIA